jgi:hypothetical protein
MGEATKAGEHTCMGRRAHKGRTLRCGMKRDRRIKRGCVRGGGRIDRGYVR